MLEYGDWGGEWESGPTVAVPLDWSPADLIGSEQNDLFNRMDSGDITGAGVEPFLAPSDVQPGGGIDYSRVSELFRTTAGVAGSVLRSVQGLADTVFTTRQHIERAIDPSTPTSAERRPAASGSYKPLLLIGGGVLALMAFSRRG